MRTAKFFLLLIAFVVITISVQADEIIPLVYTYTNPEATVVFSEPLNVSMVRHKQIADIIAGVTSNMPTDPPTAHPDNIICTLFGHNLSSTTVTATHHKVLPYDPRCLMEVYDVTVCARCNYNETTLVGSTYIICCPVD